MPKTEFRRERSVWWSIVSKAAERSNKRRTEMLALSKDERISFTQVKNNNKTKTKNKNGYIGWMSKVEYTVQF